MRRGELHIGGPVVFHDHSQGYCQSKHALHREVSHHRVHCRHPNMVCVPRGLKTGHAMARTTFATAT
jgi:hypothetical protein